MSYEMGSSFLPDSLMQLDIDAAALVYGGPSVSDTDDLYVIDVDRYRSAGDYGSYRTSVIDTGGTDTLRLSSELITDADQGVFVDCSDGSWGNLGSWDPILSEQDIYQYGQLYIAEGTEIEVIECTPGSDRVYDGDTATTIRTGDGDDYIWITGGGDTVDGGAGTGDTLKLQIDGLESLVVDTTDGISFRLGSDTGAVLGDVSNVEYFEFYDTDDVLLNSYTSDALVSFQSSVVGAVSDQDTSANRISESAPAGSPVGVTVSATDANLYDTVTYSLEDDGGGHFVVDPTTGVVTLDQDAALDYESETSHTIRVRAASSDGSYSGRDIRIEVLDHDEFDVGPVTDTDPGTNQINPDPGPGDYTGLTVSAVDGDGTQNGVTYSLSSSAGSVGARALGEAAVSFEYDPEDPANKALRIEAPAGSLAGAVISNRPDGETIDPVPFDMGQGL